MLLRTYPKVVNSLLKEFSIYQGIADRYPTILRYDQPTSMTRMKCADVLYANSCKVAVANNESTMKDNFIKGVNTSICHRLENLWSSNSLADLTYIALKS